MSCTSTFNWSDFMPQYGYSIVQLDPDRTTLASGRDLPVSAKDTEEVCRSIRGMRLEQAKKWLEAVMDEKQLVTYRRHHKKHAHHATGTTRPEGGYPVKAADAVVKVLKNAESNAESKGLNIEKLRIIHAAAQKGRKLRKAIPRAHGRSSPYVQQLTHIEIAVEERG